MLTYTFVKIFLLSADYLRAPIRSCVDSGNKKQTVVINICPGITMMLRLNKRKRVESMHHKRAPDSQGQQKPTDSPVNAFRPQLSPAWHSHYPPYYSCIWRSPAPLKSWHFPTSSRTSRIALFYFNFVVYAAIYLFGREMLSGASRQ